MIQQFPRPLRATEHCRHYSYRNTGLIGARRGDFGGPHCAVGVNLSEPGSSNKCMPPTQPRPVCAQRENYTAQERDAWKVWCDERAARALEVFPLIPGSGDRKDKDNKWGQTGEFACPACIGGKVRWTRANTNGHLWVACTTEGCFSMIQ